jgi:hypothetical protein
MNLRISLLAASVPYSAAGGPASAQNTLNLKDVRDFILLPQEQNQKRIDTRNGHAAWDSQIKPGLFTIVTRRPKGLENAFLFSEEDMAQRVATALQHAIELCGGGNKEPF